MKTTYWIGAVVALLMVCSVMASASSLSPEVILSYASFARPADDGINFNGPGFGGGLTVNLGRHWFAEAAVFHSAQRTDRTEAGFLDSVLESHKSWTADQLHLGSVYRWDKGRISYFAGGGLMIMRQKESFAFQSYLRNADGSLLLYEDYSDHFTSVSHALYGETGIQWTIHRRILLRGQVEMDGVNIPVFPIWSWYGAKIGVGFRF